MIKARPHPEDPRVVVLTAADPLTLRDVAPSATPRQVPGGWRLVLDRSALGASAHRLQWPERQKRGALAVIFGR